MKLFFCLVQAMPIDFLGDRPGLNCQGLKQPAVNSKTAAEASGRSVVVTCLSA